MTGFKKTAQTALASLRARLLSTATRHDNAGRPLTHPVAHLWPSIKLAARAMLPPKARAAARLFPARPMASRATVPLPAIDAQAVRLAERARCARIVAHGINAGAGRLACAYAFETDMPAPKAIATISRVLALRDSPSRWN